MISTGLVGPLFREGDEVVLAEGSYQGTLGIFLRLREDANWADITERNGRIRSHPVVWLAHATSETPGYGYWNHGAAEDHNGRGGNLQMTGSLARDIETWEDEGGAAPAPPGVSVASMSGTAAQVEWAERIKRQVNAEFDRVAASFRSVAGKQGDDKRADTEAIIAILEEKRAEVMSTEQAGYFIHDWQEISDQVRQMIFHDARFQTIKSKTAARRRCRPRRFRALVRDPTVTGG